MIGIKKQTKAPDYTETVNYLSKKDYDRLLEEAPEVVEEIKKGLAAGDTPKEIGAKIRRALPHKWIESKVIEAVATYIKSNE